MTKTDTTWANHFHHFPTSIFVTEILTRNIGASPTGVSGWEVRHTSILLQNEKRKLKS